MNLFKDYHDILQESKFNELKLIFKYIDDLCEFYNNKFIRNLEDRLSERQNEMFICHVFITNAKEIELYDKFADNFEHSFETLVDLLAKKKDLEMYLKEIDNKVSLAG